MVHTLIYTEIKLFVKITGSISFAKRGGAH